MKFCQYFYQTVLIWEVFIFYIRIIKGIRNLRKQLQDHPGHHGPDLETLIDSYTVISDGGSYKILVSETFKFTSSVYFVLTR